MTQAVTRLSVPPQLFGFALLLAWEILIAPFRQAFGLFDTAALPHAYLTSLPTALALVAVAWYGRTSKQSLWTRPVVILCGACAIAVPALDLAQIALPHAATVLAIVGILPKAVAQTGLFLMWNAQLAGHRAYVAWTVYVGSFAGATTLFFLCNAMGPASLTVAVFALPIASCLLYERCRALPREDSAAEGTVVWKFPWRPVLLMVAFSFAYHLVLNCGGNIQVASELGRFVVATVVLLCLIWGFDRFDVGILYKVCPALVVAGLFLCLAENPEVAGNLRGFLVSAGYSGFTLYVYMTLNTVCYRFGASAEWLFGLTRAACIVVSASNSPLGACPAAHAHGGTLLWIVGITVTALMLLSMLLLTDRTPVTTWGIKAIRIGNEEVGVPCQPVDTISYLEDNVYRCALVARHYGLTHREEEVLSLLARGSSLTEIREELSIANGTLRAHVQHIYAKLDVHSYEEARKIVRGWKP